MVRRHCVKEEYFESAPAGSTLIVREWIYHYSDGDVEVVTVREHNK